MSTQSQLREKLRKIEALFAGAGTSGERLAAEAALERVRARLSELGRQDAPIEMQCSMSDQSPRRLFVALCRRYGLKPYRYHRQRRTTVMVRVPNGFVDLVQRSGATPARSSLSETRSTKASSTTMAVEYPPNVGPPNLTESESRGPPPLRINYAVRFGHQQEGCWDESPIGGQQQVAICGLCRRTCECDRACGPGRPTARLLPGLDNAVRA